MFLDIEFDNVSDAVSKKEQSVQHARKVLAEHAVSDKWKFNRTEILNGEIQYIGKLEKELHVLKALEHYIERYNDGTKEPITKAQIYSQLIADFALSGADDGWSGRGNDLRRAQYDATLEMLRDLKYILKD